MKISRPFLTLFVGFACLPLNACAQMPFCHNPTAATRSVANAKVLNIHIMGTDDRQPEEDFGKPENMEAQRILGLREIKNSLSAVVPVECFYTTEDGQAHRSQFNGSLVCDQETLLVNAHGLEKSLCKDAKNNFVCRIPKTSQYPEAFIHKPSAKQIKAKDLCSGTYSNDDDVAILKLYQPISRKPIKIGTVKSFSQLAGRRFVNVSANVSHNYKGPDTEKTFKVSTYEEEDSSAIGKSDTDSGRGSSGSPHLIKQNGEILVIGIIEGGQGWKTGSNPLQDGRPYSSESNYSRELFFNKDVQNFLKKNVKNPGKCFRDVRPANEVST